MKTALLPMGCQPYPETCLDRIRAAEQCRTVETLGSSKSQKTISARVSPTSSASKKFDLGQKMKILIRSSDSAVSGASETQNARETSILPDQLQVHHKNLKEVNCQQICRLLYVMLKHQHFTDAWGQASSNKYCLIAVCSRLEGNLDTASSGPIKPPSDVMCNSPEIPTIDEPSSGTTLYCRQDFRTHMVTGRLSKTNLMCGAIRSSLEHIVAENCLLNDASSFFAKGRNTIYDVCSGNKMG